MSFRIQQIYTTVRQILAAIESATGMTITPKTLSANNDTVEAGYYEATTLSAVDPQLAAANIKSGVVVFGVTGAADIQDIDDADLTIAEAPTGKKFYAVSGGVKTGTGTKTLDPANDTVAAGYYAATTLDAVDEDLATANIKAGVTIFGKAGKTEVVDTVEAANPVVAGEMKTGQVGFVNGVKVTGNGTVAITDAATTVPAGYHEETTLPAIDVHLAVANIKKGVTIFGLEGTHVTPLSGDAAVGDVRDGKFFYKDDAEAQLEGTMPTVVVDPVTGAYPAGYHAGDAGGMAAVDTDLVTGNIKAGVTILGVAGKTEVVDTTGALEEAKATGTITSSGTNVTENDTVLIDAKTYTFKDALTPAEGEVLKGASASATLDNLKAAINHTGTPDVDYKCAAAHPTVEATTKTDTVLTLRALTIGAGGNAIDLVATAVTLTASDAHLAGGLTKATSNEITPGYFAWVDGVKVIGIGS